MLLSNVSFILLVGCRDDDVILRATLREKDGFKISELEDMTCNSFKDSKIWQEQSSTWTDHCKSMYTYFFESNIDTFPCGETCGFCRGIMI